MILLYSLFTYNSFSFLLMDEIDALHGVIFSQNKLLIDRFKTFDICIN